MEVIRSYLENMFRNLPKTEEMERIKSELLLNMEEKYHELKREGKPENEAIGIVISEFGNIDELLEEMGIKATKEDQSFPAIGLEEAKEFISLKKKASVLIGTGVVLIMLGVSALIGLFQLVEEGMVFQTLPGDLQDMIPVTLLILLVAVAVGLFIYSGFRLEKYKYIEGGRFELTSAAKAYLDGWLKDSTPKQTISIITGVGLCIISPVAIFAGSAIGDGGAVYGVSVLLVLIAAAVFLFIVGSTVPEACKMLLKIGEFEPVRQKHNKVIGAVAGIIWPIATCIFLVCGFIYHLWSIAWIVFPITGILFGGFSSLYSAMKAKDNA